MPTPANASDTYKQQIRDIAFSAGGSVSIGPGATYETVADYVAFLSTQDAVTVTPLVGGPFTVTINNGEDIVTLSGNANLQDETNPNNSLVKTGAWSPDGVIWYRIKQILDEDRFRLYVPYIGTNLSGATEYVGTPVWRNVTIQAGDYRDDADMLLAFNTLDACFIRVEGVNTPLIGIAASGTYSMRPPQSGVMVLNNMDVSGTGNTIMFNGSNNNVSENFLYAITGETYGVDIAIGGVGSFRAQDCVFSSANDGISLACAAGPAEWVNCELAVRSIPLNLGGPFWFPIRLFFGLSTNDPSHIVRGGKLIADSIDGAPAPGKLAVIVDSGTPKTVEIYDADVYVAGYEGNDVSVVGPYSAGTDMEAEVKLHNCNIHGESTINAPQVIASQTWAASPRAVEINWCDLNGLAVGGGGDQPGATNFNVA